MHISDGYRGILVDLKSASTIYLNYIQARLYRSVVDRFTCNEKVRVNPAWRLFSFPPSIAYRSQVV